MSAAQHQGDNTHCPNLWSPAATRGGNSPRPRNTSPRASGSVLPCSSVTLAASSPCQATACCLHGSADQPRQALNRAFSQGRRGLAHNFMVARAELAKLSTRGSRITTEQHHVFTDELLQLEHDTLPRQQRRAPPGGEGILGRLDCCLELCGGCLGAPRYDLLRGLQRSQEGFGACTDARQPVSYSVRRRMHATSQQAPAAHRVCYIYPRVRLTLFELAVDQQMRCGLWPPRELVSGAVTLRMCRVTNTWALQCASSHGHRCKRITLFSRAPRASAVDIRKARLRTTPRSLPAHWLHASAAARDRSASALNIVKMLV